MARRVQARPAGLTGHFVSRMLGLHAIVWTTQKDCLVTLQHTAGKGNSPLVPSTYNSCNLMYDSVAGGLQDSAPY